MKRAIGLCMVLAFVLGGTTGCWSVRVKTGVTPQTKTHSTLEWHFLFGLTPARVKTRKCAGAIAFAEYKQPWWGPFVLGLTAGIVSPTKVSWNCVEDAPEDAAPEKTEEAADEESEEGDTE